MQQAIIQTGYWLSHCLSDIVYRGMNQRQTAKAQLKNISVRRISTAQNKACVATATISIL